MTTLQVIWFFLIGVLLSGFAVLDGFDLGVGFWHLGAKGDRERRTLMNAIGPVWDGNEVWLLTGGGAIFAAFPPVYASVFSGFYLAMMLVLLALIARAVSLEFRSQEESTTWRSIWDTVFSLSSALAGLLFGVALGNVMRGIPLNETGDYVGTFWDLLNPYALIIGVLGLCMFAFQGANFIVLKTQGELAERAKKWALGSGIAFVVLFIVAVAATVITQPHLLENHKANPILFAVPVLAFIFIIGAFAMAKKDNAKGAFVASSLSIVGLMSMVGSGLFPRLVPALGAPELSLTLANASASEKALGTMLVVTVIGMPLVLAYIVWVYRAFSGKVDMDQKSNHY